MGEPFFSVIIPTLNEEKFLPNLLDSLGAQSYKNFEVVVVDGSSQDKTVEIARSYSKKLPNLQVVVSKKASLPLQRNLGAEHSTGTWLAFIDADSVVMPYFFERIFLYIETYKPRLLTTWFRADSETNGDAMLVLAGNMMIETSTRLKRPMAPGPLSLVTRDAYTLVGGYDIHHAYHEDVDFGMRLYKAGVSMSILRETLYILSLRRLRQQGKLKILQQYVMSAVPILFFNTTFKHMPGYTMGGQLYKRKIGSKSTVFADMKKKIRKITHELF